MTVVTPDATKRGPREPLDPVTFEVLKNAFTTIVDEMAEQILRSCHSFAIYNRDFSSAIADREGNTVAQGTQDLASHVGTLHFTAQAIVEAFGDDMKPGDVFAINDPYLGGTHFSDVRVVRPIFYDGKLVALAQSNGHWADVGGSVPGSFDVTATEHFGEGLRIPPVRLWDGGRYLADVARLIVSNTREPSDAEGDLFAQEAATRVAEEELHRLIGKYGIDCVLQAFDEVQDYTERLLRKELEAAPDGEWESEDYLDFDPTSGKEGLIPVHIRMRIRGGEIEFDLSGSHGTIGSIMNSGFGGSFSGVVSGMKMMLPDIPLNSGFYRPIRVEAPHGTIVNSPWPVAVSGFLMTYEKIINTTIEMWSELVPDRAMAASYQEEYLLIGGRDLRGGDAGRNSFMWYDYMGGGWGGRNGLDGADCLSPIFGVGLMLQSLEGQERLSPVVTSHHELLTDSGGPGEFRGGVGASKGAVLQEAEKVIMSYLCDRERSILWGINGGLPSNPLGVTLRRADGTEEILGAAFAKVPLKVGDEFLRPSAGGGGFGDPLERDPERVLDDVIDGYVSVTRAARDYGVVIREVADDGVGFGLELDAEATTGERQRMRQARAAWLKEDPEAVARRFRAGELDALDLVRQYGVILDWGTGEVLPETTQTYRGMLARRAQAHWTA